MILILFILVMAAALLVSDRIGVWTGCKLKRFCEHCPVHLPAWVTFSIAILLPSALLSGLFGILIDFHHRSALEVLSDNLEIMILAGFSVVGFCGGFFWKINSDS